MGVALITGATGFVGTALCHRISCEGWQVRAAVRSTALDQLPQAVDRFFIGDIGPDTDWTRGLKGIDAIVHLAARTHVINERNKDPLQAYRLINVQCTEHLARAAAASGVKRFIYLSSVKVNGEGRPEPYTELDVPSPEDAYGISKWEAEHVLRRIETETGMGVVIVRPPLVYGAGVKANFLRLMQIIDRRIPLPLASIRNSRSMIFLDNLVDAIMACLAHKEAAGRTYLVSDGEDISTPELVRRLAHGLERKAYLFPVPEEMLRFAGRIIGKTSAVDRLLGNLTVDTAKIQKELNWKPPYTMEKGLKKTANWFRRQF